MRLGVFFPRRENAEVTEELQGALERVLRSGRYLLGEELAALERELAEFLGIDFVVGVGSGTDALILALQALGIRPGDEVLVPAFGAVPTVAAVVAAGAVPVLCDVNEETACLDPEAVAACVGPRTVGVVLVHLYGYPAPADEVSRICAKHGLFMIEDCAQAFGASVGDGSDGASGTAKAGTLGHAGCFSFYPTKVLGALGDGGAVATRDLELASRLRLLRAHGHEGDYRHTVVARNSRLDEIQAAVLRVKLRRIDNWIHRRREVARRLRELLAPVDGLRFQLDAEGHSYHLLAARHSDRDLLLERLRQREIELMVHYPLAISDQPAYAELAVRGKLLVKGSLEASRAWARTELSLPTAPQLAWEEIERVADAVAACAALS